MEGKSPAHHIAGISSATVLRMEFSLLQIYFLFSTKRYLVAISSEETRKYIEKHTEVGNELCVGTGALHYIN